MSVGRVGGGGRGGRAGGAGGAKGAGSAQGTSKAGKAQGYGKVDRTESLVGASGAAGSANVGATEAMTAAALEIVRQVKASQVGSQEEFRKRFVEHVLKEKLHMKSKALTSKIVEQMQDDPRLNQALERLWQQG